VSHLNQCKYCVDHHAEGLKRLLNDDKKYNEIRINISIDELEKTFDGKFLAGIHYAKKLTLTHHLISQKDMEALRAAGFDDGEILEVNQVVSYFNYVNRTVVGLGVNTDGDILGLSPNESDDPNNWSHK